jgi:predicted phage terminase large subunit-like protein
MFDAERIQRLRALPLEKLIPLWDSLEAAGRKNNNLEAVVRELCKIDLAYLLIRACRRKDLLHPWLYERIREVESAPNGHVDLWSREHGKSSIITFGQTISDILNDPEITFGLFSHTRPIAKAFLRQIMRELEENQVLHKAFPDVLWGTNVKQSPKWSEDDGIIVKRKGNPKEATIEAWGLVDGQPTSKHYKILLYDDIVVRDSVTTPEMIAKTMQALAESYSLGVVTGGHRRFIGTRWHFNDAYSTIMKRGTAIPREHPGRIGGVEEGESVLWPDQVHVEKRRDMGAYVYACQILLNPKADDAQGFKREWLQHYTKIDDTKLNKYLLVDAASSKKKGSDYTAMWVIGLGMDGNYYALDVVRDRLNLKERGDWVFRLHRKWKPKQLRYEGYGMMADIEYLQSRMEEENYRFQITKVAGVTSKVDRIKRLLPIFEQKRFYLPKSLHMTTWEKTTVDLVNAFIEEEYLAFPVGLHDDMFDSLARIAEPDLPLVWPQEKKPPAFETVATNIGNTTTAWMS